MLYKPVYMPSKKAITKQPPPTRRTTKPGPSRPAPPSPPLTPPPQRHSPSPQPRASPPSRPRPDPPEQTPEPERRIPMLISSSALVIPAAATRDVLAGRVDYYLVDDTGMTLWRAKHCLNALKLDSKMQQERLLGYACVGGHQQVLEKEGRSKKKGLGYRRRYLDPEVAAKGIYGD